MFNKVLVIAADYDDCLVRRHQGDDLRLADFDEVDFDSVVNQHIPPQNKDKWKNALRNENNDLLDRLEPIVELYDMILLLPGSNRQFPAADTANSCRGDKEKHVYTGCCYEGMKIFQEMCRERFKKPVELDLTTTADFFRKCPAGETASQTLEWLATGKIHSQDFFKDFPNDRTKISLHYAFMHKAKRKFPNAQLGYLAIDDSFQGKIHPYNPAIIDALAEAFTNSNQLMPPKTTCLLLPYQQGKVGELKEIKSSPENQIDPKPFDTMKMMMACSLDGRSYKEKEQSLMADLSCDCWSLFAAPDKLQQFFDLRAKALQVDQQSQVVRGVTTFQQSDDSAKRAGSEDDPLLTRNDPVERDCYLCTLT